MAGVVDEGTSVHECEIALPHHPSDVVRLAAECKDLPPRHDSGLVEATSTEV